MYIYACRKRMRERVCERERERERQREIEKDMPAQSLVPPGGRASRLQRCSGSAATEQDLCKTYTATSEVNWATTFDCVMTAFFSRMRSDNLPSLGQCS